MVDVQTLVEQKISEDTDFQETLIDLSDEDKEVALNEKRTELTKQEFDALEAKATKAEEIAKNQEIRARKAEELAKQLKKPEEKETPKNEKADYTLQDIRALSDVHDDDVEEVERIAKLYNISIPEAKKLPLTQTLLKQKTEERATAQATNTAVSRKGASKVSGEDLAERIKKGEVLSDDEQLRAIEARWTPKEK